MQWVAFWFVVQRGEKGLCKCNPNIGTIAAWRDIICKEVIICSNICRWRYVTGKIWIQYATNPKCNRWKTLTILDRYIVQGIALDSRCNNKTNVHRSNQWEMCNGYEITLLWIKMYIIVLSPVPPPASLSLYWQIDMNFSLMTKNWKLSSIMPQFKKSNSM